MDEPILDSEIPDASPPTIQVSPEMLEAMKIIMAPVLDQVKDLKQENDLLKDRLETQNNPQVTSGRNPNIARHVTIYTRPVADNPQDYEEVADGSGVLVRNSMSQIDPVGFAQHVSNKRGQ